jgi:phosphoribosylaminoimidazolecarboxamide formyltransferase/IMP cyclohydrolase
MAMARALLSVTDKTDLELLAKGLIDAKIELVASGGTAKFLTERGLSSISVESITGNPESFDGRMKTISFQIGSGILFRRDHSGDQRDIEALKIKSIDLVVCNLYPFIEAAKRGSELATLVENVDVGGPTMIRAAAKNHRDVIVLTSPKEYPEFLERLKTNRLDFDFRLKLAALAFERLSFYDACIAREFNLLAGELPKLPVLDPDSRQILRYGENPHQQGAILRDPKSAGPANAPVLQGKEISYNNLLDADAAWRSLSDISRSGKGAGLYSVAIVKHGNPCGLATAETGLLALQMAWAGDPISAFGGILCLDFEANEEVAQFLSEKFVEVVIAPSFDSKARQIFSKKKNVRLLELAPVSDLPGPLFRSIGGGAVWQEEDNGRESEYKIVAGESELLSDSSLVSFGISAAKHLKSNAIALVAKKGNSFALVGAGMGNPNRLISLEQAVDKAHENGVKNLSNTLLISDAFFPFADTVELASKSGVGAIIQPGGSLKDSEVIAKAVELKIPMAFSGMRHFRH